MVEHQLVLHLTKSRVRVSPDDGPTERGGKRVVIKGLNPLSRTSHQPSISRLLSHKETMLYI